MSPKEARAELQETLKVADAITQHIFQWGPYAPADYGPEIDWAWDPAGDIEWVAAIYRFYWARPLGLCRSDSRLDRQAPAGGK
ncbi:MAG: hypothetical protein DCC55_19975 [Chloroflexi bacterium]|nr:MAG: hypothetical protein DCC55_19975 [Chloroflexota bacterium]